MNRRRSFLTAKISQLPFQLLPNSRHGSDAQERILNWQAAFIADYPQAPELLVVIRKRDSGSSNLLRAMESLAVQSYQNFQVILLTEDLERDGALLEQSGLRGEAVLPTELPARLSGLSAEHVVLMEQGVLLHPQALFCLVKELLRKPAAVLFANSAEFRAEQNLLTYVRRAEFDPYLALSKNPVGGLLCVSKSLIQTLLDGSTSPDVLHPWCVALRADSLKQSIRRLPLGLSLELEDLVSPPQTLLQESQQIMARAHGMKLLVEGSMLAPEVDLAALSVNVVIPFHNAAELTIACLESILAQSCGLKISVILVDNRSTAEARAKIEGFIQGSVLAAHCRIVDDGGYFNFARLCNRGARAGSADLILFLNNDVEIDRETLAALCRWSVAAEVGVAGGILRYPSGATQHAGIAFAPVRPQNTTSAEHDAYTTRLVDGVSFAMALVKRPLFEKLGGLDEWYCPNGFGDALFCQKVAESGAKILLVADATGLHHESPSRGRSVEDLELYEMVSEGLPISDLTPDFVLTHQPMRLQLSNGPLRSFRRKVVDVVRRVASA